MGSSYSTIVKKAYEQRLANQRKTKGLYSTVIVPKGQHSIKILPISNLYYGNPECPPRLKLLDDHIQRINDMEEGAFFLGGNLFYYPPGTTDEKAELAEMYADHLYKILERADKNKILFVYDGVNEQKFKDDRKLKYPIETTSTLAEYLDLKDRYYADTKVELKFVFNNELTSFEDQFMLGLFTSLRPISLTKNAVLDKIDKNFLLNSEKDFVIDTSSSLSVGKRKVTIKNEDALVSVYKNVSWLSPAGYSDITQTVKKNTLYNVNCKLIELTIRPKIPGLHQDSIRKVNTVKDDPWDRVARTWTIGVNHQRYFDPEILEELNKRIQENVFMKEQLTKAIDGKISDRLKQAQQEAYETIYQRVDESELKESLAEKPIAKESTGYTFE
jgi:hypothetical protein